MNRGGSIRKARKDECVPCLVMSDTGSGIHSERQQGMAHFYTWSATMYELRSARLASLRSDQGAAAPCAAEAAIPSMLQCHSFFCWSCEA